MREEMGVRELFRCWRESARKMDGYESGIHEGNQNQLCHTKK